MAKCLEIQQAAPGLTRMQRLRGVDPLRVEARSWFKGAQGEREVARALDGLGPEWFALHAVPVGAGSSDIDHVLIGPGGVFTINTKNHAGKDVWVGGATFQVNGFRRPHIRNSRFEGERASLLLSKAADLPIVVQPLIVVSCASLTFGHKRPDVVTLRPGQLRDWLLALPRHWSTEGLAYLAMVAEERRTWHVEAVVVNDTLRHLHRFERLERDIDDARNRRKLWKQALPVAALALPAGWLLGHWWGLAALSLVR